MATLNDYTNGTGSIEEAAQDILLNMFNAAQQSAPQIKFHIIDSKVIQHPDTSVAPGTALQYTEYFVRYHVIVDGETLYYVETSMTAFAVDDEYTHAVLAGYLLNPDSVNSFESYVVDISEHDTNEQFIAEIAAHMAFTAMRV